MFGPRTRKPSPDTPPLPASPAREPLASCGPRAMGEDRPEPVPGHVE